MARKFNCTNFPLLKHIGAKFDSSLFYKNIFLIDGWEGDELKLQRKLHRDWYDTHRAEFGKHIYILDKGAKFKLNGRDVKDARTNITEEYEESGVFIKADSPDCAYLYTAFFHTPEYIKQKANEGIETADVVVRIVSALTSAKRQEKYYNVSSLGFIDMTKDNIQLTISDLSCYKTPSGYEDKFLDHMRIISSKISALALMRHSGNVREYNMEHGSPRQDDIEFPFINYSGYNLTFIKGVNCAKENRKAMFETNLVCETKGGPCKYCVEHGPIDYVQLENNIPDVENQKFWGLATVFNPLSKDSAIYKKLYKYFEFDEPAFIGRMLIPYADDYECRLIVHRVYVVRCMNNGTTYFVSDSDAVLQLFCH